MSKKLVFKRKKFTKMTTAILNSKKPKKILETVVGPGGKILKITSITRGKPFSIKEAVQRGVVSVSKRKMLELFTEQELKRMNYKYE